MHLGKRISFVVFQRLAFFRSRKRIYCFFGTLPRDKRAIQRRWSTMRWHVDYFRYVVADVFDEHFALSLLRTTYFGNRRGGSVDDTPSPRPRSPVYGKSYFKGRETFSLRNLLTRPSELSRLKSASPNYSAARRLNTALTESINSAVIVCGYVHLSAFLDTLNKPLARFVKISAAQCLSSSLCLKITTADD